jgi:hypothetical protein
MSPRLLRPKATSGFNPKNVANLEAWFDAADSSTMTTVSGAVSEWRSKAGATRNLTQGTAANRPALTANYYNGRSAVSFDGSNDVLFATGLGAIAMSPLSVFIALDSEITSATNDRGVMTMHVTSATNSFDNNGGFQFVANSAARTGGQRAAYEAYARAATGSLEIETTTRSTAQPIGKTVFGIAADGTNGTLYQNGPAVDLQAASASYTSTTMYFGSLVQSGAPSLYWQGKILEILVYARAVSASERAAITNYLGNKWGVAVTPVPAASNADAQDWIDRVYANGGTVSASTAAAVNTFCNDIDAAGLRSLLWRVNLFAGDNLSACLVPLFRGPDRTGTQYGNTTDTNDNFVSGDYDSASGLVGNGSTKRLNTGLPQNFADGRHLGIVPNTLGSTAFRYYMGAKAAGSNNALFAIFANSPTTQISAYTYSDAAAVGQSGFVTAVAKRLHFIGNTAGSGNSKAYADGIRGGTNGLGHNTTNTGAFGIFAARNDDGTATGFSNARLSGYTIGNDMTESQVATYNTIWTTLLTALGRA